MAKSSDIIRIKATEMDALDRPLLYNIMMMVNRHNITLYDVTDYIMEIHPDMSKTDASHIARRMKCALDDRTNITASSIEDWCNICGEDIVFTPQKD